MAAGQDGGLIGEVNDPFLGTAGQDGRSFGSTIADMVDTVSPQIVDADGRTWDFSEAIIYTDSSYGDPNQGFLVDLPSANQESVSVVRVSSPIDRNVNLDKQSSDELVPTNPVRCLLARFAIRCYFMWIPALVSVFVPTTLRSLA